MRSAISGGILSNSKVLESLETRVDPGLGQTHPFFLNLHNI